MVLKGVDFTTGNMASFSRGLKQVEDVVCGFKPHLSKQIDSLFSAKIVKGMESHCGIAGMAKCPVSMFSLDQDCSNKRESNLLFSFYFFEESFGFRLFCPVLATPRRLHIQNDNHDIPSYTPRKQRAGWSVCGEGSLPLLDLAWVS